MCCSHLGLAYNGMCGVSTSQSVSVDNGLMTALTAAHELAHKYVLIITQRNASLKPPGIRAHLNKRQSSP